jgi:hypothetical protein
VLQVRLDGFVLLVELGQVRDDIFYDVSVREGVDLCFLLCVARDAAYSPPISTILSPPFEKLNCNL